MEFSFFIIAAVILAIPFLFILLILWALNWNEKKSIFFDAWFVYLTWLLSGFLTCVISLIVFETHYKVKAINTIIYLFAIVVQTLAVAATLYWRSRPQKEKSLLNDKKEYPHIPKIREIWKFALLSSVLTSLMMLGFYMAVNDIENKMRPKTKCCSSFEIYD